ncbi:Hypothetical predicted protein [Pelobates cultripes]|uniref:Uncharacterized protein n=1 Tax=Pelobates cultripes TaxID=61616 RepID=A0AAD1WBJ7_PELCU|nr:Hypothetical predicted protein [Pelobates cultripes]
MSCRNLFNAFCEEFWYRVACKPHKPFLLQTLEDASARRYFLWLGAHMEVPPSTRREVQLAETPRAQDPTTQDKGIYGHKALGTVLVITNSIIHSKAYLVCLQGKQHWHGDKLSIMASLWVG